MLYTTRFILLLALVLATIPSASRAAPKVAFDENHEDMFVFLEKKAVEKDGYYGFCKKPPKPKRICIDTLKYKKYVGKRGYFVSMDVIPNIYARDKEVREVILETGERFYFSSHPVGSFNPEKGRRNIRHYSDQLTLGVAFIEKEPAEPEPFESYPIVPGSSVSVIRSEVLKYEEKPRHWVDDGTPFYNKELDAVQRLLSSLKTREYDEEIVKILQNCFIEWDRIEQRYIVKRSISILAGESHGPVRASIIGAKSSINLYDELHYEGSDWLFVDRYVVVAGDARYESPSLTFKRDHSGGKVWEWVRQTVNLDRRVFLEAIAMNNDAVVRFYGKDYYADRPVNDGQREALRQMLRLHDLLVELSVTE